MRLTWRVRLKPPSKGRLKSGEMPVAILGCRGCGKCLSSCEFNALVKRGNEVRIDYSKCRECRRCIDFCPYHSIIWIE
ncbi:MAG: hypothetical protein PWR09_1179 [Archaeoglobi archaeon]|nr:hypothetical protein [Archaeoglobi archaeon]